LPVGRHGHFGPGPKARVGDAHFLVEAEHERQPARRRGRGVLQDLGGGGEAS
jgi:hypothetical protein